MNEQPQKIKAADSDDEKTEVTKLKNSQNSYPHSPSPRMKLHSKNLSQISKINSTSTIQKKELIVADKIRVN